MTALVLILVAILLAIAAGVFLCRASLANYSNVGLATISFMVGLLLLIGAGITAIAYVFMAWSWMAAGAKANIINREYNTTYTREEVFLASDVIDTVRELDRKRVEVNGDLFREQPDQ